MNNEPVIVETTYQVPVQTVWQALTQITEIRKWYFQIANFTPSVGFTFDFTGGEEDGEQFLHFCVIKEVEENKKLSYTWRYDNYPGNSVVTWDMFDKDGQTLLRITHTGLETFAQNGPMFSKESFLGGWTYFIHTALKKHLEPEE